MMATNVLEAVPVTHAQAIDIGPYLDLLEANGPKARRDRMVPEESVEAVRKSGLLRALVPEKLGGIGATMQEYVSTLITIAERDMSTAWISGIISVHAFQIALLSHETQAEVYGENPDRRVSSSYNPVGAKTQPVEGGVMLHGRWGWSSGCDHCEWALLGSIVEGRKLVQTMLVPRSDYEIEDTWHVMGLQGTGSKDIVIKEPVFVPDRRIHSQYDGFFGKNDQENPMYSLPWAQIFAHVVAVPAIGAVRHALKLFIAKAAVSSTDPTKLTGDPDILRRVAEVRAMADNAEMTVMTNLGNFTDKLERGEEISLLERARARFDCGQIVSQMIKAVDLLFDVAGGRSVFDGSEIQQIWLDIHMARAHVANNPVPLARNYGNILMGGENADYFL